ncbi:MAG TPA: class II aldolase/adducin family protein [Terriglobales bacterium]|nr:class II aldolase/adducin family protein [Terriglobales bacterium]
MSVAEREMIRWSKLLFERRLISGWGGNLSCRLGKDDFLITGQHAPLGFLTPKDLVRIKGDGRPVGTKHPSSETPMHLAVYHNTEAQAIVHVHPPAVLAFSLAHDSFFPVSFEEKYTIGEVPIVPQDTPTVTRPDRLVHELKYHPVVILKAHGTVACGRNLQEAFLLTDLLEEAVRCHFFRDQTLAAAPTPLASRGHDRQTAGARAGGNGYLLFSKEHMTALVTAANGDPQFRSEGRESGLSTSLTLLLEETDTAWTVRFVTGEIVELNEGMNGEFMISGAREWWSAVFSNRMDPFFATQQGKLKLQRGELAMLSRWYKPFERAFALWQTIPVQ